MNPDRYAHITDQQLLDHFYADRDNHWLGILLPRYTLLLFGVCMKYLRNEEEARDGVQQVFLKVITELPKYKVEYFKAWLYMVTKNHCLMKIREGQGRPSPEFREEMSIAMEEAPEREVHLEKDRQLELMTDSISLLSSEQKQCVTLFYLDKRTYQEIAEQTGFTIMQVKSYIQNGKRNLKLILVKKINQR